MLIFANKQDIKVCLLCYLLLLLSCKILHFIKIVLQIDYFVRLFVLSCVVDKLCLASISISALFDLYSQLIFIPFESLVVN